MKKFMCLLCFVQGPFRTAQVFSDIFGQALTIVGVLIVLHQGDSERRNDNFTLRCIPPMSTFMKSELPVVT